MIRTKNYEKMSKFVKVTAKIQSVLFSGHGVQCTKSITAVGHRMSIIISAVVFVQKDCC